MAATTPSVFKIRIRGPEIRSGSISVPELIKICEQAQAAVNRQAEALEGERSLRPGPIRSEVKRECTLELLRISKGSTVLHFGFTRSAEPQSVLFPMELEAGKTAVTKVIEAIGILTDPKSKRQGAVDVGVADSFVAMGKVFGPVSRLEFTMPRENKKPLKAVFDTTAYPVVTARAQQRHPDNKLSRQINGIVEMADFKAGDHRCRLVPLFGSPVICGFTEALEDRVTALVRKPAIALGTATLNPQSGKLESFEIESIEPLEPTLMALGDFTEPKTIEELIASQGVKPLKNISQLKGLWIDTPGRVN